MNGPAFVVIDLGALAEDDCGCESCAPPAQFDSVKWVCDGSPGTTADPR